MTIRRARRTIFVALLISAGCSSGFQSMGIPGMSGPPKVPQGKEMDYGPPIKMRIEHCYWDSTSGTTREPPLVVEIAATNYGHSPLMPTSAPVFELTSSSGNTYAPGQGTDMANFAMFGLNFGKAINPGSSVNCRLEFDVPRGTYELPVYVGQFNGAGWIKGGLSWIWELSPSDAKQ